MIETKNILEGTNLAATASVLYTAPTGQAVTMTKATLVNHSASSQTYSFWLLPSGVGATSDRYLIVQTRAIPAGATYDLAEMRSQTLNPGDSIWANASNATTLALRVNAQVVS